jgi:hypothetical protein
MFFARGAMWLERAVAFALLAVAALLGFALLFTTPFAGGAPSRDAVLPYRRAPLEIGAFERASGEEVTKSAAAALLATDAGRAMLSPHAGTVRVTGEMLARGREAFYNETFGDEAFFSDVVGLFAGPITPWTIARAVLALGGKQTTNLRVRLDEDVMLGGARFSAGEEIDTGLDVPRGALVPLGVRVRSASSRIQTGLTCALCHATVDPATGRVVEGAPNADLRIGLLLALAPNSAAVFRNTGADLSRVPRAGREYIDARGERAHLPDPRAVEDAVDADLVAWPPGTFDATPDARNDPTGIPPVFTFGAGPYGWSGNAAAGYFGGLVTAANDGFAQGADATSGADTSTRLLGMDRETYLGVVLQEAALARYRPPSGAQPSDHLRRVDPTPGAAGLNELAPAPTFPGGSVLAREGLVASEAGRPFAESLIAIAAFEETLAPPPARALEPAAIRRGAEVFARAGCGVCHAGTRFTNHEVIAARELGTEPSRAAALAAYPSLFFAPRTWPPDARVPIGPDTMPLDVTTDRVPESARLLAFAEADPAGGYKVPSLLGLAWTAPYLHDGSVAVAADALEREPSGRFGLANPDRAGPGLLYGAAVPDAAASLRALIDRGLRAALVTQNRADGRLARAHVDGSGHAFWIDAIAGFSPEDQDDVVAFLLSLDDQGRSTTF